jgi:shikimate kinase
MKKAKIALIGFRATGKSLVGRILAQKLSWAFVDMDERLEASLGMDIQTWVKSHGWESFRKEESKLLERLASEQRAVVATGGGVVLDPANRKRLKDTFLVVWLQASSEVIFSRMSKDPITASQRPSLTGLPMREEVDRLLQERLLLYEEISDLVLPTDEASPDELTSSIAGFIQSVQGQQRAFAPAFSLT